MTTHGHARAGRHRSPEYKVWASMRNRCKDPKADRYPAYGGRGIRVCQRWDQSFEAFLADMGHRPGPNFQIDRIDNDGNYEPGNCRWVTRLNNSNNRRDNRMITAWGQTRTLAEWSRRTGLGAHTIAARIDRHGWAAERALSASPQQRRSECWRSRPIEFDGRSMTLRQWAEATGIKVNTIASRVDLYGWPIERALTTPVRGRARR